MQSQAAASHLSICGFCVSVKHFKMPCVLMVPHKKKACLAVREENETLRRLSSLYSLVRGMRETIRAVIIFKTEFRSFRSHLEAFTPNRTFKNSSCQRPNDKNRPAKRTSRVIYFKSIHFVSLLFLLLWSTLRCLVYKRCCTNTFFSAFTEVKWDA